MILFFIMFFDLIFLNFVAICFVATMIKFNKSFKSVTGGVDIDVLTDRVK